MRITASARKHGVSDDDMLHAHRNYIKRIEVDELVMYIGPARNATMLEVGTIEDGDPRIIHAMPARRKFWP